MQHPNIYHNFIISFAGPYGAGCSALAGEIEKTIKDWPGCISIKIKVSRLIQNYYEQITNNRLVVDKSSPAARRKSLQEAGTNIRKKDPNLIGKLISNEILKEGTTFESKKDNSISAIFFIIDSLKNTHDFKALKGIYGGELFLVFVHANGEHRWERMRRYKSWQDEDRSSFFELDKIDSDEKSSNPEVGNAGQEVRKVSIYSDYYIVNNHNDLEELQKQGKRFLELILGNSYNQPTFNERAMHLAYSASNRSFCLSRQVGAAIVDLEGNILGVGHNDVPKAGGGLYTQEDSPEDKRCYCVGDRRCTNDSEKANRFSQLLMELCEAIKEIPSDKKITPEIKEEIDNVIKNSDFKELTEFCRAVHAEMEALLAVGRISGRSTSKALMYVTAQPCHNCVKHILCAGISKVFFIEPYPKSLATTLHWDSIILDPSSPEEHSKKLLLVPYEGVAPKRFHDFFALFGDRKDKKGFAIWHEKKEQADKPRFSIIKARSRHAEKERLDSVTASEIENSGYLYELFKLKGKKDETTD